MWFATHVSWDWTPDGMRFYCETEAECHLFLHYTLAPPSVRPVYRWQRGLRTLCGKQWRVTYCRTFEQIEPGLGLTHTFFVTDWPWCSEAWWYLRGYTWRGWSGSQSLLYTDHRPYWADPFTPPERILVTPSGTIARAGNHYTFYANDTWYAVVPSRNWIEVYKLVGTTFIRQDFASQPAAFGGRFHDCDCRLSVDRSYIHVLYTWRNDLFPPDWVCYCYFDLDDDSWGTAVYPVRIDDHRPGHFHCSMARDSHDNVHAVFNYRYFDPTVTAYVSNYHNGWGTPAPIISTSISTATSLSAACGSDDVFHVLAAHHLYHLIYNSRPLDGPTGAQHSFPGGASNVHDVSITAPRDIPYITYVNMSLALKWGLKLPEGWAVEDTLPLFSPQQPNIFASAHAPHLPHIIVTAGWSIPTGLTYDIPQWRPWNPADTHSYNPLALTRNGPGVASYLAHWLVPPGGTYLYAFPIALSPLV